MVYVRLEMPAEAHFLNVDLDLRSRASLAPLIAQLRPHTFELHVSSARGWHDAHYEVAGITRTPDATIKKFVRLLARLDPAARRCWDRAQLRDFNIGIQAGTHPRALELPLAAPTVRAVADLGARIVITVYPVDAAELATPRRRRASPRA